MHQFQTLHRELSGLVDAFGIGATAAETATRCQQLLDYL
jgi:hypothetical protein